MLNSVFTDDFKEIHDEYDEDNFYLDNYQNKKLYMINLLKEKGGSAKSSVTLDNGKPL